MRAGELRHQVTVERKVVSGRGAHGQPIYAWSAVATVPAAIEDLAGRRLELARMLVGEASHTVTIRYLDGIGLDCRLVYGNRILNIGDVQNPGELNFRLVLTCVEERTE